MNIKRATGKTFLLFCLAWHFSLLNISGDSAAADTDPIAYIGHGAFFDPDGKQINLTQDFIERAQAYYRQRLLSSVPPDKSVNFLEVEKRFAQTLTSSRQNRLALQNSFIRSLVPNSSDPDAGRIGAIINALEYALELEVPDHAETGAPIRRLFVPDPQVRDLIEKQTFLSRQAQTSTAALQGQQYIDECKKNGVPIPPPVGKLDPNGGWKRLGFIPPSNQFITGSPAELRVFTNPQGMCFSLPRYTDETLTIVMLDGVICLSEQTSKVCIWDNQMPDKINGIGKSFRFDASEQIPIGVPDPRDPTKRYQSGAFELGDSAAGICTDCHAGENPYVIHPNVDLGGGLLMGKLNLPTSSSNRYQPIVPDSWPQNTVSEADKLVPPACQECHYKELAGRFPQLSNLTRPGASKPMYRGYCGKILPLALKKTMPPNAPGSLEYNIEVLAFLQLCALDPAKDSFDSTP